MATFTAFNDRLPDPAFDVNDAGAQVTTGTGKKGAGFASVSVTSKKETQVSRTRSGRGVHRESGAHQWEININYHPMTRDKFDVVQTFLEARNARLHPFYVVLPQHSGPKSTAFRTTATNNSIKTRATNYLAGSSYFLIDINDGGISFNNTNGTPSLGDFFTFQDNTDVNHKKVYKITRVETSADHNTSLGNIGSNTIVRLHVMPPLVRDVPDNTLLKFIDPMFRVIQKTDVLEYQLDTNNLYQFQLQLEEILP